MYVGYVDQAVSACFLARFFSARVCWLLYWPVCFICAHDYVCHCNLGRLFDLSFIGGYRRGGMGVRGRRKGMGGG